MMAGKLNAVTKLATESSLVGPSATKESGVQAQSAMNDLVKEVRREAEFIAQPMSISKDLRDCDSCGRKCEEDDFCFGSYRADMCKLCVKRITGDTENLRSNPVTRIATEIGKRLEQINDTAAEELVDMLQIELDKLIEVNNHDAKALTQSFVKANKLSLARNKAMRRIIEPIRQRAIAVNMDNRRLRIDNDTLKNNIQRLQKGIDRLKLDNGKRKKTIETQKNIIKILKKDNDNPMQTQEHVRNEAALLQNSVSGIDTAYSKLTSDQDLFDKERAQLFDEYGHKYAKLETEYFQLSEALQAQGDKPEIHQNEEGTIEQRGKIETDIAGLQHDPLQDIDQRNGYLFLVDKTIKENKMLRDELESGRIENERVKGIMTILTQELERERTQHRRAKELLSTMRELLEICGQ